MYRIFCESYENFVQSIDKDSVRLQIAKPLKLLTNIDRYKEEKKQQTELYKKTSDLLYFLENNIEIFPRMKAFLWTIASREMLPKRFDISSAQELEEQAKLLQSF